ncbi:MAG: GNAT family N-acetyltransferase [Ignavibacteriota bacterium]
MAIILNRQNNRFEIPVGGELAHLDYEYYEGGISLTHTYVPPKERHQGIAFALVKFALEYAKAENLKVIPGCSSVMRYLEEHPEYAELVENA